MTPVWHALHPCFQQGAADSIAPRIPPGQSEGSRLWAVTEWAVPGRLQEQPREAHGVSQGGPRGVLGVLGGLRGIPGGFLGATWGSLRKVPGGSWEVLGGSWGS